jgi:hypothetical protein
MWANTKTQTTSQRGYGTSHQKARAAAIAAHRDGDPCARCGHPMHGDPANLDLDHSDDRTQYRGLAHRQCNRSAGGRKGRRQRSRRATTSRTW